MRGRSGVSRRQFLKRGFAAVGAAVAAVAVTGKDGDAGALRPPVQKSTEQLQREFAELRFGMFIHFNMSTFTDLEWDSGRRDPLTFNPAKLDCGQWADAAKSAGMKFAALTTKHHDGFCLWDTKLTAYNSMNSAVKTDVVKQYVDAFRSRGIGPGIYFSMWDRTADVGTGNITPEKLAFVRGQLTELLTNYGEVPFLIIDGWCWKMGHLQVPYEMVRDTVKRLQPNCLMIDHNGLSEPWEEDVVYFEGPKGVFPPEDNTRASILGQTISRGWFWHPWTATSDPWKLQDAVERLTTLEKRYCNLQVNCPPNREGILDANIVARLKEIGQAWKPDGVRPPLPPQPLFVQYPISPKEAKATSEAAAVDKELKEGKAINAIDGFSDMGGKPRETLWRTDGPLPQSITIDLGQAYSGLDGIDYLPSQWYKPKWGRALDVSCQVITGYITSYRIHAGIDGSSFSPVAEGKLKGDHHLKNIEFPRTTARYIRLEILEAVDNFAAVSELTVGGRSRKPEPAG